MVSVNTICGGCEFRIHTIPHTHTPAHILAPPHKIIEYIIARKGLWLRLHLGPRCLFEMFCVFQRYTEGDEDVICGVLIASIGYHVFWASHPLLSRLYINNILSGTRDRAMRVYSISIIGHRRWLFSFPSWQQTSRYWVNQNIRLPWMMMILRFFWVLYWLRTRMSDLFLNTPSTKHVWFVRTVWVS